MVVRHLFPHRRRPEPVLDVGLAAERTGMAWQRTALALAAFSAVLAHLADRSLVAELPGLAGLALALVLLVVGERRYALVVERVEQGESSMSHRMVVTLTVGVMVLAAATLLFVVLVEP